VPKKGHYTLAQDYVEKDRALDFFYSFTDLEEEWGGFVTYMSEEVNNNINIIKFKLYNFLLADVECIFFFFCRRSC